MPAPGIVTLIGVALAVVVIALYLIAIAAILQRVFGRLEIILGAVSDVIDRSAPAGDIIGAINADLAVGDAALAGAVERLQARVMGDSEDDVLASLPSSSR